MAEELDKYTLKNGMVLLGERMEGVESAAFGFMLPCGAALLPEAAVGREALFPTGFSGVPVFETAGPLAMHSTGLACIAQARLAARI